MTHSQLRANQQNAQKSTGPRTEEGKAKARYNARRHGLTGQFYVMDDEDRQAYLTFETGLLGQMKPVGPYEEQLAVAIAQDHWRINRAKGIEFNTFGLGHAESGPIDADSAATESAISHARTWRSDDRHFSNMALYELRLHRIIAKNKKELNEEQAKRQAAEAKAKEEAELFLANELSKHAIAPLHHAFTEPQQSGTQTNGAAYPRGGQPTSDAAGQGSGQSGPIPTALEGKTKIEVNGFVFSIATLFEEMAWKQTLAEARFYKANNWDRTKPLPFTPLIFPKTLPKAA